MLLTELVRVALLEDLPNGDKTSELIISDAASGHGYIEAHEPAIISGLLAVAEVFRQVDSNLQWTALVSDGFETIRNDRVVEIRGSARSILAAERTALNFLGYLSGIATLTSSFVKATRGTKARILGTRKILPGFRALAADAIRHGGGDIYRTNLSEFVLIKDNHLVLAGGLSEIQNKVEQIAQNNRNNARELLQTGKLEVDNFEQLEQAIRAGWKNILLDNFSPQDVQRAVDKFGEQAELEASGGIDSTNVADYAATGVQYISIGALTHSVRNIDFGMELTWNK